MTLQLTQTTCDACARGDHAVCRARLPSGSIAAGPCACVPCGQQWELDALGVTLAVVDAGQVRSAVDREFGVECNCCENFSAVVARFNTRRGGVYMCKSCLDLGGAVIAGEAS